MPATKRLVLDLPAEHVDMIEARVAGGEYPSASALIAARLEEDVQSRQHDDGDWKPILDEIAEEERQIGAGHARTYSLEEVFTELHTRIDAKPAGPRHRA